MVRMDPDDRLRLWALVQRFNEGRLRPLEQAELRELVARFSPASFTKPVPALIETARFALGLEVVWDVVREREAVA